MVWKSIIWEEKTFTSVKYLSEEQEQLLLLLATGRRASEVLQLRWGDLLLYDGGITIYFHCKAHDMRNEMDP